MTDIAENSSSESVRQTRSHQSSDFTPAFQSEGVSAGTGAGNEGTALAAPSAACLSGPLELRLVDPRLNGGRREVAFIDASVADHQALVAGVRPGVEVLLLQAGAGGLAQMAAWAGLHGGYDAIHLLSHGTQARLHLGDDVFTCASLSSPMVRDQLAAIGRCLTEHGDLLIYGCEIGKGDDGARFVTDIAAATGAGVAASSGLTGSSSAGGDWMLETISGGVTAQPLSITGYPFTLLPETSSYSGGIRATNTYYRPWTPADIAIATGGGTEASDTVFAGGQITQISSKLYNYAFATFIPTSSGAFTFSVPAADLSGSTTDAGDVFMAVYETSFDPKDPLKNLLYANDDSAYAESDFRPTIAGVPLNAFGHYVVVITSFSPSATGSFTVEATGPALGSWAGPDAGALPVITSGDAVSFLENGTGAVYAATVNTRSADGAVTYALGGADAALFALDSTTGVLTFKTAPDFETPADSSGDNIYNVTLSVSDGSGTAAKDIAIAVTDVAESPIPALTSKALTSSAAPVLTGTARAGVAVTVEVAGATYKTMAAPDGRWSLALGSAVPITGILALDTNGANSVTVSVEGEAGSTETVSQTLTIDTTAPAVAITSTPVTSDTTPVISGTAEAGSLITVRVENATYSLTAADGTWSLDLGSAVPLTGILALSDNGTNSISVTARDPAGNTGSATQTLLIDTIAPTVAITSAPVTSDMTPVITGTADADSTVTVTVAGATYSTTVTDGLWSVDLGSARPVAGTLALPSSGANTISATATDPAGNISAVPATATLTIDPSVPAVVTTSGILAGSTYHRPWTPADLALADGQGANATPTVYRGSQITATSDLAYAYAAATFTPAKAGSFTFAVSSAEVPDAFFSSDVFMAIYRTSFDPEHPLNNLIYANDDTSAEDYRPTIPNVLLEPFTRYIVVVSANDPDVTGTYSIVAMGPAGGSWMEADTSGSFAITSGPSADFAENGTGPVYAAAVSAGGDAVAYALSGVDAGLFTLDPATGILTFKSAPDYERPADSGGDNVYDVTLTATGTGGQDTRDIAITVTNVPEGAAPTITSGNLTSDITPVITGTASAGSVVTVAVAGATYAVTATGGTWSLDLGSAIPRAGTLALDPNGANSVSVKTAGEESPAATQQLTIDTTAPTVAITSGTRTGDTTPVITGTAEAGATVTIAVENATYSLVTTDGTWSLDLGAAIPKTGTLTLNLGGANRVSVTATDAAGNTAATNQTLILDVAAAATTLTSGQLTGNVFSRPWTPADIAMVEESGSADTDTVYTGNEISDVAPDLYNYATAVFVPILAGSFTFSVSAAHIPDASFDFSDVFMAVYKASFDPEHPLNNLIYANDDTSAEDYRPTIPNILLQPFTGVSSPADFEGR